MWTDGVELVGEVRLEVMAHHLGLGTVDDADGPLQTRDAEALVEPGAQKEPCMADVVEQVLDASRQSPQDAPTLSRAAPVPGRGDRPVVGGEADQQHLVRPTR